MKLSLSVANSRRHEYAIQGRYGRLCRYARSWVASKKGQVQKANEEAWYWFSSNGAGTLHRPRLSGKARTRNIRKSLFWFRDDSYHRNKELLRRARQLAEAITMADVEIREINTTAPGRIVWEDSQQVLALPEDTVPKAFS